MIDVMLDLETLSTRHNAMIIQIGACYFDRNTGQVGETFKATINATLMSGYSFDVEYKTVKWWMEQSPEARSSVMRGDMFLPEALLSLRDFLEKDGEVFLWSHATFDMPILMHAFETYGIKCPVPYKNTRDLRTLMDLAGPFTQTPREGIHHDALDDAIYQAQYAAAAFNRIHGTRSV